MPSRAAPAAACRRAFSRSGSRLATAGVASSKTVTPSGMTPSASPTAARCRVRYAFGVVAEEDLKGGAAEEGFEADPAKADEELCDRWPKATVITAMTTTKPTRRSRRIQWVVVGADDGVRVMPPVKAVWRCQRVSGFRYADDMRGFAGSGACGCWSSRMSSTWRKRSAMG